LIGAICVLLAFACSPRYDVQAQERTTGSSDAAGIEPDEIDARQRARSEAAPRPATSKPPARSVPSKPAPTAPMGKVAPASTPAGPQKYETAECGTPEKPITCCTKGDGPGASCNLFILLCNEGGGTGKGDGGDAICVN
jgi:hypothetical protein